MCIYETVVLRGTERYHMEEYLVTRGYVRDGANGFVAMGITVRFVLTQKIALGTIWLTEVTIAFEGNPERVDKEIAGFRLQFMTAGG